MEHKLIRGGEQYLPFARSRIKALKATGLQHASQQFEIDGVSVKVRIDGEHEYISLEGGHSLWVMIKFMKTTPTGAGSVQEDVTKTRIIKLSSSFANGETRVSKDHTYTHGLGASSMVREFWYNYTVPASTPPGTYAEYVSGDVKSFSSTSPANVGRNYTTYTNPSPFIGQVSDPDGAIIDFTVFRKAPVCMTYTGALYSLAYGTLPSNTSTTSTESVAHPTTGGLTALVTFTQQWTGDNITSFLSSPPNVSIFSPGAPVAGIGEGANSMKDFNVLSKNGVTFKFTPAGSSAQHYIATPGPGTLALTYDTLWSPPVAGSYTRRDASNAHAWAKSFEVVADTSASALASGVALIDGAGNVLSRSPSVGTYGVSIREYIAPAVTTPPPSKTGRLLLEVFKWPAVDDLSGVPIPTGRFIDLTDMVTDTEIAAILSSSTVNPSLFVPGLYYSYTDITTSAPRVDIKFVIDLSAEVTAD
jgi:hypothetical protein